VKHEKYKIITFADHLTGIIDNHLVIGRNIGEHPEADY